MDQWFSKQLVSEWIGLKCFLKKAIFSQYFTVVEQFLLQFVKISKTSQLGSVAMGILWGVGGGYRDVT